MFNPNSIELAIQDLILIEIRTKDIIETRVFNTRIFFTNRRVINPSIVACGAHWNTIFDNIVYYLILILLTYIYTLCYHTWKFFYK
jgi:hypothetical protein